MDLTTWVRAQWDRVGAWTCIVIGGVVLIVGWIGVSGTEYPANQLPYILSGGIGGIFLLGLGATLWLSADLRDEWHKLDRIDEHLARLSAGDDAVAAPAPVAVSPSAADVSGSVNGTPPQRREMKPRQTRGARAAGQVRQ